MDFEIADATTVDAPPDRVFARVIDLARLPEWNREIREIHDRPPELAVGRAWVVEIRAMGTHWRSRSTVVDLDIRAGLFAYRSQSDDGNPSFADWVWRVVPNGEGGTDVQVQVSVRPRTFWRRYLFSNIRKGSLRAAVRRSLDALRASDFAPSTTPITHHERNHA